MQFQSGIRADSVTLAAKHGRRGIDCEPRSILTASGTSGVMDGDACVLCGVGWLQKIRSKAVQRE